MSKFNNCIIKSKMVNNLSDYEKKRFKDMGYNESFIRQHLIGKMDSIEVDDESCKIIRKREWIDLNPKFYKNVIDNKVPLEDYKICLVAVQQVKPKKFFSSHFSGPITLHYEIRNQNTGALVYKKPLISEPDDEKLSFFYGLKGKLIKKPKWDKGLVISKKTKWYKRVTEESINNKIDETIKEQKVFFDPKHYYMGYEDLLAIIEDYNKPTYEAINRNAEERNKAADEINNEIAEYKNNIEKIKKYNTDNNLTENNDPFRQREDNIPKPILDAKYEKIDQELKSRLISRPNCHEYKGSEFDYESDRTPLGIVPKKLTYDELNEELKEIRTNKNGPVRKTQKSKNGILGPQTKAKGHLINH